MLPKGQASGRPSKAMALDVALQLIRECLAELSGEAKGSPMVAAYAVLSWTTGIRTEEARALLWSEVDLDDGLLSVIRSARTKGQTKTPSSRRALELPEVAVDALRMWQAIQVATDGHVFTTATGTKVDSHNMAAQFQRLCKRAGIGDGWVPRELRHSYVSALSASGVPVEQIAYLVGHSTSQVTEAVYRKELRPRLRAGASAINAIMGPEDPD